MLTAHTGLFLHPEYMQPLSSAPVSIELDAKKSPLALLAQTCSQIGKSDPPLSKAGSGDKDAAAGRPAPPPASGARPVPEDKMGFKPYHKDRSPRTPAGPPGATEGKLAFRGGGGGGGGGGGHPPISPTLAPPPAHTQQHHHPPPPPLLKHSAPTTAVGSQGGSGSGEDTGTERASPKKDVDGGGGECSPPPENARSTPHHQQQQEGSKCDPQVSLTLTPGHIAPISPYKASQPLFPLPYHGPGAAAAVGYSTGYAASPQFVPGSLDQSKPKPPGSGCPLSRASPPSLMQGLMCRDPYCLSYPGSAHLGGGSHDHSSSLKSPAGYHHPMVYPSHALHSLHAGGSGAGGLSPGGVSSSYPHHSLYAYGFMLPSDPLPHACNWVSAGGPCDKRFPTTDELLVHLRSHTALHGGSGDPKLGSPVSVSVGGSGCHMHAPYQTSVAATIMPGSFPPRPSPPAGGMGLARYHPYSKVHHHLAQGQSPMALPSMPSPGPYYPAYALYGQRLGCGSALGYP